VLSSVKYVLVLFLITSTAAAQVTNPYAAGIRPHDAAVVGLQEFAALPDIGGVPARMMLLAQEPGTRNLFVNDMRGPLYRVSADGKSVTMFVSVDDERWGRRIQSQGRERGFQSFAFHPQYNERGSPGYGRFYTWSDVADTTPAADFTPGGGQNTHDMVLLEWTAKNPAAPTYDGDPPREVLRVEHPFANHNGGLLAFNPLARPGQPDFGMLYVGSADGGSGGDPLNLAQNMASPFGKILRINPLGRNSRNGKYGIPADNPFVSTAGALGEIWASGVRNPQRFGWDPANGRMYVADIGQNIVEEISLVPRGGNLGWNTWEASFRYAGRTGVDTAGRRGDANMTFPIAEYDHTDSVLSNRAAVTGVVVYRASAIAPLRNRIVFGDMPSGEVLSVSADEVQAAGQDHIRRVLFQHGGTTRTFLQVIRAKNTEQGKQPAARADLRFGTGPDAQVFLLNKADGMIRLLMPPN
jgi:hypothetical protein